MRSAVHGGAFLLLLLIASVSAVLTIGGKFPGALVVAFCELNCDISSLLFRRFLFFMSSEPRSFCECGLLVHAVQLQHCGCPCSAGEVCGGKDMSVGHHSQCAR